MKEAFFIRSFAAELTLFTLGKKFAVTGRHFEFLMVSSRPLHGQRKEIRDVTDE